MTNAISNNMLSVFELYNSILNSDTLQKNSSGMWDIVVLTTFDELQQQCFQQHIDEIFANKPLFKKLFRIIADPPGQKLGCGGSTLHALKTLLTEIGGVLFEKKTLIIHSGGSSQRLPSYSSQGKIFSPIPIKGFDANSRVCHMIDLKLAMYLPFCRILGPGVFVSCADDIETYNFHQSLIDNDIESRLKESDVVALAHPCDLDTAEGHGVYVLPKDTITSSYPVIASECLEVLQKPSKALMREKHAVIQTDGVTEEIVYSDSAFWMSERVCQSLLSWYAANSPLTSELDAYGHFLPCLGANAKASTSANGKDSYKSLLFPVLKDFNFNVLVLKESKFYHLGSMDEYLHHFTSYKDFINELHLVKNTSNISKHDFPNYENCMLIYSFLYSFSSLKKDFEHTKLIIEWSQIELNISITGDLILSNCVIKPCGTVPLERDCIPMPKGFLFHTMPVCYNECILYVTVAFEINSNMKALYSDTDTLFISAISLTEIMDVMNVKKDNILPPEKLFSLFDIKLFQAGSSPEESFWKTFDLVDMIISCQNRPKSRGNIQADNIPYFSMRDIVAAKDLKTFLDDRRRLLERLNISF